MKSQAQGRGPAEKSDKGPATGPEGTGHVAEVRSWVTTQEACKMLDMQERGFRKLRVRVGGIAGGVLEAGQWRFPKEAIVALLPGADAMRADEDSTGEENVAALMRETARGMETVVSSLRSVLGDVVGIVKPLADQIAQARIQTNEAHKLALEAVTMVKDLLLEGGKMEADSLVKEADQTVRVERTKLAARGMRLFMPLVKSGAARWLGNPAIAKDGQAEGVLELVRSLKEDKPRLQKLFSILNEKQVEAITQLLGYAEGREKLTDSLRMLRGEIDEEQMKLLGELLTSRELNTVQALFEDAEDNEPEKKKTA